MTPDELKEARATLGMSRRELAEASGYSYRAIVSYEDGWRSPFARPFVIIVELLLERQRLRRRIERAAQRFKYRLNNVMSVASRHNMDV